MVVCAKSSHAGFVRAALLVAPLLLAGCASGASISYDDIDISYDPGELQTGTLPLIVRGNPFPIAPADFGQRVAAAMSDHILSGRHFVPANGARIVYRVVMDFQGGAFDAKVYCGQLDTLPPQNLTPVQPLPGYGPTSVLAVVCRGDREVTAVYGTIDRVTGPDDPLFTQGIRSFTARLLPPRNPSSLSDGNSDTEQ